MEQFFNGYLHTIGYLAAVYLALSIVERFYPAERGQPIGRLWFNIALTPILLLISGLLLFWMAPVIQPLVNESFGQRVKLHFPTGVAGSLLAMLTMMFVADFVYYWWHRFQHMNRWLWAQHTLHHSERSLNVAASLRHHWLEDPFRLFIQTLPLGFAFYFEPPSIAWVGSVIGLWPFFIHMNLRLRMGPLTAVFAGPQYHRIHHSILPPHRDKNFAAVFPIWDIIFGTAHLPAKDEFPPTGIDGVEIQTFGKALASPFVDWSRMARALFGGRDKPNDARGI